MLTTKSLIDEVYAAFNRRDMDGAFARMSETVSWPRASEGGQVVGKNEIRAYWMRQWAQFDPTVEPLAITEDAAGRFVVKVHQVVKSLTGEVLSDSEVEHVYTIADGLIERMDLAAPSAAFGQH